MKSYGKKTKIWIILTPIIVVSIMFLFAFVSTNWYQKTLQTKLEKSSKGTNLFVIYNKLNKQIENLAKNKDVIFNQEDGVDDKRLIEYFQLNINKPNDVTFILRLDKQERKLKVLYTSSKNIKVGTKLPQGRFMVLDRLTIKSLLDKNSYFTNVPYDHTSTLYKLFKYYPTNNLVIYMGTILEKHSITYSRYIKSVIGDINSARNLILTIEFLDSLIGALIISFIIKRTMDKFENAKDKLEKSNESLKLTNRALKNRFLTDSATNLPNETSLRLDISNSNSPKLMLVDIDEFRKLSEYYPRKTIDKVIFHVKYILLEFTKKYDEFDMKLYRTDTHQFALLENAPIDMERYEDLAIKLSNLLKGVRVKGEDMDSYLEFNCTIGFSLEYINTYETATTALRRAKEKEKDYICYFKVLDEEKKFKSEIKGASFIKKALENDRVIPFFQPIYDGNRNITKHECLVRIRDEKENIISPYMFLDTSKRIKRYTQIEKALIKKSLDAIEGTDKVVSINLSSRDMIDSEVKHYVIDEITKRDLAKQIIFEIVEDENIDAIDRVRVFIDRVKSMGIRIAIDDFGSGYSNFSYLLSLKPDFVKIDGSLIKNIDHDHTSHAIVSSIILFTKRLKIKTVAEYVHNEKIFEICKDLGIDEFQGFYLSEPKPHLS